MKSAQWKLLVTSPARRDLDRLTEKTAGAVIEAIGKLVDNPRRLGKPLGNDLEGCWALRRGPYRVIYLIDDQKRAVEVVAVGHRSDVYRRR